MGLAKRVATFNSEINVTPMLQKGLNVDLAKTNNPIAMEDADKEDAILVAITKDGSIFFDTEKVTLESLQTKVQDKLSNKADKKIYIKSDARARYGVVVQAVDAVRTAGVDQVGLLTEQKKPSVNIGGD
jgi:biopolymer transport protein ExbD/biopolymer transport protein TolR